MAGVLVPHISETKHVIKSLTTNITVHQRVLSITKKKTYFISLTNITTQHRYLIYARWLHPTLWAGEIEARSQALVAPTELTGSMIICIFCIAEVDKVDNKSSFRQLKSINTQMHKSIVFSVAFFDEWERPIWPPPIVMRGYRCDFWLHFLIYRCAIWCI